MSEIANSEGASESEKPVHNDIAFPPFPDPTDDDFGEDISEEERSYYKTKFKDLNIIKTFRLHCSACDRHMGCSARNERMRAHPMLRTLVCHSCHAFYNSGEFEKGDDGSELYCRWCGQGGQVYCCSDCPHVFCAKCIKRNLGTPKIKEIENADDWKCFKCTPDCLRDLRAICWAVLRYCDLKNKITHQTQDPDLKAAYQKDCALDLSECCRNKRRNQKLNESVSKKKEIKKETKEDAKVTAVISKMPSTIQVKKFAALPLEETLKIEKKAQKRPASPKQKTVFVKNPIAIAPCPKILTPITMPPLAKKIKLQNSSVRFPNASQERKPVTTYARIRPKLTPQQHIPVVNNCFNGFASAVFNCSNPINDNINLSLESLTQGLDMATVAAMSNNTPANNSVVCTPDFPLEPLCEVTEDNDDDVECITPVPVAVPKMPNPPPLVPRSATAPILTNIPDVIPENIIQMTENDVTVNESTGGLKFRVDPQTLSSNKMYRLPDGRIFAINANPNMPGGYSATIVAITEANKSVPKGATFAAKLSSVSTSTPNTKTSRNQSTSSVRDSQGRFGNSKRSISKPSRSSKTSETSTRECDLNVPIEWYRYNLIDAVDALEYSLSRLNKLKKEATSVYLRTRAIDEMRSLHTTLERLLNTSSSRFNEIRENLNKGFKRYISKKTASNNTTTNTSDEDDDDDVEILPDVEDDPIFIDENSIESNINISENQEIDLTGPASSECNDSHENKNLADDPLHLIDNDNANSGHRSNNSDSLEMGTENKKDENDQININGIDTAHKDDATITLTKEDLTCNEKYRETEINGEKDDSSNKANVTSKNDDTHDQISETNINDKADSTANGVKMADLEEKIPETDDNLKKDMESDDKLEKIMESDDKLEKIMKSDVKLEKTMESDDNSEAIDLAEKTGESADKPAGNKGDIEDKIQDLDDKTQDGEDKLQDTEMSDELIETLLKDDTSQDNIPAEVPEALQVT